jgi:hypothetical protein
MLENMSPTEQIAVRRFAEDTAELIRNAILSKDVTGYGPSNASGKLVKSVEIEYHSTGFRILAEHYIYYLIYGRKPGRFPNVTAIRSWIQDRGIRSELPINSLAYLIARKIAEEGSSVWRKYKGADSGLLDEALSDERINEFIDSLGDDIVSRVRSEVMITFGG